MRHLPRPCKSCGRPLRTPTADRHLNCYRDWLSGPAPVDTEPDWVVVDRLVHGELVDARANERHAAVQILAQRGHTPSSIARTMRMSGSRTRELMSA